MDLELLKKITVRTKTTTNYLYLKGKESSLPTMFLHGFAGSYVSWADVFDRVDFSVISIDLPGHGESVFNDIDLEYSIDAWCDDFNEILNSLNIQKVNLCAYSMGGRLAIAFAGKHGKRVNKLILESSSYGIETEEDRKRRFQDDLGLCREIELDLPGFVQKWQNNPLFSNQETRNLQAFLEQQETRLSHNPTQLSKALKSFSQGKMSFYEERILNFEFPVVVINGAEDRKYVQIGSRIADLASDAKHYIIPDCGHNVHLEKTNQFIDCLK